MSNLSGQWIGNVYGTNAGNAFMELEDDGAKVKGTLRFNDPTTGIVVFRVAGKGDDKLDLELTPTEFPAGVAITPGSATAVLQPDGGLMGRWETKLGTAGTFRLQRQPTVLIRKNENLVPEQFFFHRAAVGSVRITKPDLEKLIQLIAQDFVNGKVVVSYFERGVQITKYANAFIQDPPNVALKALKLAVQEPEGQGLNRIINVDLVEGGGSLITTSSGNESWATGQGERIRKLVQMHENKLVSWYRQYGLTINSVIFLALLVVIPGIADLRGRAACVGAVWLLSTALTLIYNRLVPNTLVLVSDKTSGWWSGAWRNVASWLAAIVTSLIASLICYFYTKH